MNNSTPITNHRRRWCSLILALSAIASFTLAENTDPQQLRTQQTNNEVEMDQTDHASTRIKSEAFYVGNSNDQYTEERPISDSIQIDLNQYLNAVANVTIADVVSTTKTDEDGDMERLSRVKNPIVNLIPKTRFTLWSNLTPRQQQISQQLLYYTQTTWDNPMTNPIEMTPWNLLSTSEKSAVSALKISPSQWDCHINHYYGYFWDDLIKAGVEGHFEELGWDRDSWEYGNKTKPDIEGMHWDELSWREKEVATELCYFNRGTWDELPLETWLEEWMERYENGNGSFSKGSTGAVVQ